MPMKYKTILSSWKFIDNNVDFYTSMLIPSEEHVSVLEAHESLQDLFPVRRTTHAF